MKMLLIEQTSPGFYRLVNGPMTLEVFGKSVDEVLSKAMSKSGIPANGGWSVFEISEALETLMGSPPEKISWNHNIRDIEEDIAAAQEDEFPRDAEGLPDDGHDGPRSVEGHLV